MGKLRNHEYEHDGRTFRINYVKSRGLYWAMIHGIPGVIEADSAHEARTELAHQWSEIKAGRRQRLA